ncbi:MAG TPA: chromate resistance protein ChrB domain-containing protein [Kiloniellaceae bacterium]
MGNSILHSPTAIAPEALIRSVGTADFPIVFDVRRREAYDADTSVLPTARWRDHRAALDWGRALPSGRRIVVYCVHGHQVSLAAVSLLRSLGLDAGFLEGGIEAYRAAGGPTIRKAALPGNPQDRPSQWITRERPKIDRIACPWFIRRFVDREALIHYVPKDWVTATAEEIGAIPFDIPDVAFSHSGEACSFDAFLARFGLGDPALLRLAEIVRGADTARLDLAPQAAGLLAMSLGLSATHDSDEAMLERGMTLYDALYGWCRFAAEETHNWPMPPQPMAEAPEYRA